MRCPAASAWTPSCTAHRARCRGSRASKPTPPSSPPRMFPAPGQATGPGAATTAPWGALDVNNGAPHPAGARSRPNASSAAHHGGSRPSLESSTHAAALSRSSAHDRWRAAGAAAGVPQDVGEGTKKKRSDPMRVREAEHGDPVEEGQGGREGVGGERRGQAPGRRRVRVRATPEEESRAAPAENAPTTTTTPEATKNKSARDLWAAAGAAAGVTDAAVASAAKKRSPLLMAYKKMKRIAGIPSKKDKEAEKAEKAAAEARANFPATPKTLRSSRLPTRCASRRPGGARLCRRPGTSPRSRRSSDRRSAGTRGDRAHRAAGASAAARRVGVGTRRSASAPVVARASGDRVHQRDVGPRAGG